MLRFYQNIKGILDLPTQARDGTQLSFTAHPQSP